MTRSDRPLIALAGLRRSFTRGGVTTEVLRGIDLTIEAGEFVAIMGESGSGKSTLMNILGLLDVPTGGTYRFGGQEVATLSRADQARLRRDVFGFVFQRYHLLPRSSARENVELPAIYAGIGRSVRMARAR